MRQLKGILFIKGVYWENVVAKESDLGRVEVLSYNKEKSRWEVLSGSLDKTKEGYTFKTEDLFKNTESFKLPLKRVKEEKDKASGFMDFCLGAYFEPDDGDWTGGIVSFPELLADYLNDNHKNKSKIIITGFATANIPGNAERPYPTIFRNIESITPRGFYVEGKFWAITGSMAMRAK